MSTPLTIALAGNPNAGKSTIFNALTGSRQHVGNWPGKTVEKKEGVYRYNANGGGNRDVRIVDLPGAYSLTAYSAEEIITRDYILEEKPQVVIDVIDAANIERNLYLAVQLLELGARLVIALNMSDVARDRGLSIDQGRLSAALKGTPVIATVASKREGLRDLMAAALAAAEN